MSCDGIFLKSKWRFVVLRDGFVSFYCFECLEKGELIYSVNFENIYIYIYIYIRNFFPSKFGIGIMVKVFTNSPGDLGSIPGRVIPWTQKMVLDAALLNIQHYKVRIKGKVEQSRERSSALTYTLV